jgi:Leucine-rich repeat (LRR) protein
LSALPDSLKILHCSDNNLTSIPKLPCNLQVLVCHNNKITSLTRLPKNIELVSIDLIYKKNIIRIETTNDYSKYYFKLYIDNKKII